MEFSRQEYPSGLPFPTPGNLPNPGIAPASLLFPALAGDSLPLCYLESVFQLRTYLSVFLTLHSQLLHWDDCLFWMRVGRNLRLKTAAVKPLFKSLYHFAFQTTVCKGPFPLLLVTLAIQIFLIWVIMCIEIQRKCANSIWPYLGYVAWQKSSSCHCIWNIKVYDCCIFFRKYKTLSVETSLFKCFVF